MLETWNLAKFNSILNLFCFLLLWIFYFFVFLANLAKTLPRFSLSWPQMPKEWKLKKKRKTKLQIILKGNTWPIFMFLALALVSQLNSNMFLRKWHFCEDHNFLTKISKKFENLTIHELTRILYWSPDRCWVICKSLAHNINSCNSRIFNLNIFVLERDSFIQ